MAESGVKATTGETAETGQRAEPDKTAIRGITMSTIKPPSPSFVPELPRRTLDIPGGRRSGEGSSVGMRSAESRRLIVGREIVLSGDITACETLVVEGRVDAKLQNCQAIEIASTGVFKGSAEIDDADISGRFEGNITVRGRLTVRSTGRIEGEIRYGQLEIEAGGEINGDVKSLSASKTDTIANTGSAAD
ncbi:hypothetical protein AUP43_00070 [Oceanibaculum pacificum]|uniref:Cell shape determination protein CcmA n=2 Tax=Oceanibaculum pacificum TaxID=580166 RepID=A0A154WH17_9PROT|nr:hypothetical protein AUP43_00070 [Oceanibaculum pacificum]